MRYTSNIKRGDDGGALYMRTMWALEHDPIASMLSQRTLNGLAIAYSDGMSNDEGNLAFNTFAARVFSVALLNETPLSILSEAAKQHIGKAVYDSWFPEDVNN